MSSFSTPGLIREGKGGLPTLHPCSLLRSQSYSGGPLLHNPTQSWVGKSTILILVATPQFTSLN